MKQIDDIKKKLEWEKYYDPEFNWNSGLFYKNNRFTEDLEYKVKELLMSRNDDSVKDICRTKNIRISPSATKESLVTKILHALKLDCARTVEYETD